MDLSKVWNDAMRLASNAVEGLVHDDAGDSTKVVVVVVAAVHVVDDDVVVDDEGAVGRCSQEGEGYDGNEDAWKELEGSLEPSQG